MPTRREFLGLAAASLWLGPSGAALKLKRWWPLFPRPHEIWVVPAAGDMEEGILLESAAGLTARAALHGKGLSKADGFLIYEDTPNESYRNAFRRYCEAN